MTIDTNEPTAMEELTAVRRSLQDAGITLLKAATAAVSAAANETLRAMQAMMIAAADGTLAAAEDKVNELRAEFHKRK